MSQGVTPIFVADYFEQDGSIKLLNDSGNVERRATDNKVSNFIFIISILTLVFSIVSQVLGQKKTVEAFASPEAQRLLIILGVISGGGLLSSGFLRNC